MITTLQKVTLWGLIFFSLLGLGRCTAQPTATETQPIAPAFTTIECLVAYRSSVTAAIEVEETIQLSPETRELGMNLGDLAFHARYTPGNEPPNEHSLRVWVTTRDNERETELVSQLFQLPLSEPVRNQFTGGHGFAGLSYVYHPNTGAELQYTCQTRD